MPGTEGGSRAPSMAPSDAGSEDEDEQESVPQRSRRLRSCVAGVGTWWQGMLDTVLPPPPPPPSKLSRKEKIRKKEAHQAESMRKKLFKAGINLKEAGISHLSDKRLREFYEKLDDNKKRIFTKAPKVATLSAAKLFEEYTHNIFVTVQLPWGMKRGHNIPVMVKFTVEEAPYDPDEPGPKQGYLRMTVEQEGGLFGPELKSVYVMGVHTTTGADNIVTINTFNNMGNVMIMAPDEPTRWKWFCAVNAGLHRVAAARVMLDQPAAIVPWHDKAVIEKEIEN